MSRFPGRIGVLALVVFLLATAEAPTAGADTERVSVDSAGAQASWTAWHPSISGDGRYVAFSSSASNLVADDTNNAEDIFVRDRRRRTTERVSVDSAGGQVAGGLLPSPVISSAGRHVAFISCGSMLVAGDTNHACDVFVHDRRRRTTERVNVDGGGRQSNGSSYGWPAISADGRYVAFSSYASNLVPGDTNGAQDVFVHDRESGATERVSVAEGGLEGNGNSVSPAISADGRYVAFASCASNLVTADTNDFCEVFVRDRQGDRTERVSVDGAGGKDYAYQEPVISSDGRYVASVPMPRTWYRATRTARRTSSSATAERESPSG